MKVTLADGQTVNVRDRLDLGYIIQGQDDAGLIKVGRSANPEQRVAGLISGVPFKTRLVAVFNEGARREKELKVRLAASKVHGEWFKPTALLQNEITRFKRENALVSKRDLSEQFFRDNIQPLILEHLTGRSPALNPSGDFLFRVLHEGYPAIGDRLHQFLEALGGRASPELLAGYLPLPFDAECPVIANAAPSDEMRRAG